MIAFLNGIVAEKGLDFACIDVGGVGYALSMPQRSVATLPAVGQSAKVLCRMSVTDSGATLYGFASEEERRMFDELIQISGIGPKIALAALSFYTPTELIAAVSSQDVKAVSKIPGVGKKSASRIILELKDKFQQDGPVEGQLAVDVSESPVMVSVVEALRSMGFTKEEIEFACKDADEGLSESELLQHALKRMA